MRSGCKSSRTCWVLKNALQNTESFKFAWNSSSCWGLFVVIRWVQAGCRWGGQWRIGLPRIGLFRVFESRNRGRRLHYGGRARRKVATKTPSESENGMADMVTKDCGSVCDTEGRRNQDCFWEENWEVWEIGAQKTPILNHSAFCAALKSVSKYEILSRVGWNDRWELWFGLRLEAEVFCHLGVFMMLSKLQPLTKS